MNNATGQMTPLPRGRQARSTTAMDDDGDVHMPPGRHLSFEVRPQPGGSAGTPWRIIVDFSPFVRRRSMRRRWDELVIAGALDLS